MTPEIRAKIVDYLAKNGFSFGDSWGTQHGEGLPIGVSVRPEFNTGAGGETLAVTTTSVQRYRILCPTNHTVYRPVGPHRVYNSPEELLTALKVENTPANGCWK